MPSHSATLIRPKFDGLPLPEHSKRCGPIFFELRGRSSSLSDAGVASSPLASMRPRALVTAAAAAGISVRMYASSFGVISLLGSSIERSVIEPGVETHAADLLRRTAAACDAVAEERQRAEQLTGGPAGDARHIGGEPGEDFARIDQRRRACGGQGAEDLAA